MHSVLRDENGRRARGAEIVLLVASTLFVSTTFAGDDLYHYLGVAPETGRLGLGVASVLAFAASIAIIVADWRGRAAGHRAAVANYSSALETFRRLRGPSGEWAENVRSDLNDAYWSANANSVPVPESDFTRLKAKHRRKVRMSQIIDDYPWCPRAVASIALVLRQSRQALRSAESSDGEG